MEETRQTASEPVSQAVMDVKKNQVSKIELDPRIFDAPFKQHLLHQVVVAQESWHRRGTASAKTRAEVSGGGKKPWRQKGTGRARAGSNTSPIWVGGGVTFGPKPRDYSKGVPKKVRKAALRIALSQKRREGKLLVLDELKLENIKTKEVKALLDGLDINSALLVTAERDEKLFLSARNLRDVKVLAAEGLNVRDMLLYDHLVIAQSALAKIEERLA